MTVKAFIDASVLFSACYSDPGASFDIFQLSMSGQVQLVISDLSRQKDK
jgi:predicted nucleic acid-binding protein